MDLPQRIISEILEIFHKQYVKSVILLRTDELHNMFLGNFLFPSHKKNRDIHLIALFFLFCSLHE